MNIPAGTNNISIPVPVSRTRHGKPDAVIPFRIVTFVTTAAFGACSSTVYQGTYVNALAKLALPLGVVTATLFAPTVPAGVTAVILVDETTTTLVAVTPPTVTLVAPVRFVPVIVIGVPPPVEPDIGVIDVIDVLDESAVLTARKPQIQPM